MRSQNLILGGVVSVVFLVVFATSCGRLVNYLPLVGTALTSTSLASTMPASIRLGVLEGGNWVITPTKISGRVLSIVLPIDNREDEGVVIFGDYRPDIAQPNSALKSFDLSQRSVLRSRLSYPPWFQGGNVSMVLMLFGYFDVDFRQGNTSRTIRFVYGETDPLKRGDKLLKNAELGEFEWFNTATQEFSSTRPTAPRVNTLVRDFTDPIRPQLAYYMLSADLNTPLSLTRDLLDNFENTFTIDFEVGNTVLFSGVSSEAEFDALTPAELIEKFDMKQNVSNWRSAGITASLEVTSVPR